MKLGGAWRSSEKLGAVIVALAAIAVFANSIANGFAYDDDWIITRNDRVHQLEDLGLIWRTPYWPTFGNVLGLYRPLAIFGYAVQWAIADGQPWFFHLVNTLLHAAVAVLVLVLLRKFASARAALAGALVFAVHPVHTEAVANVVGQAELLAALGILGACLLYLNTTTFKWWHYLALPALYLFALFAKEASIVLPGLLILLDAARRDDEGKSYLLAPASYLRTHWLLFFVLSATVVLYLAIRVDVLGSIGGSDAAPGLPFLREDRRILTAFRAWPEYLRLLFFPKDLSIDYAPAVILPVESLWQPMALLGALFLALTVVLALLTPKHPHAGLPAGWFFISIFTVSNLLLPIGVVIAERTLYTPSIAVAFVVAFVWQWAEKKAVPGRLWVPRLALALALVLMAYRTVIRNPEWKDTITILNTIVRDHPESYRTAWLMADHYWRQGDVPRSRFYWEAALLLWPRDSQLLNEFGNFNIGQKNWKRAIELLERSRDMVPWVPHTQELLAFAYAHGGEPRKAVVTTNDAVRNGGRLGLLHAIRARAYDELGNYGAATGSWRASLHQKGGGLWIYRAMLARSLARYGDTAAALAAVDTARQGRNDPLAIATLDTLRAAIARGCYANPRCPDPIAGWDLTIDPPAALRPQTSQIATVSTPAKRN